MEQEREQEREQELEQEREQEQELELERERELELEREREQEQEQELELEREREQEQEQEQERMTLDELVKKAGVDPVLRVVRNDTGQIVSKDFEGGSFDISKYVGCSLYTAADIEKILAVHRRMVLEEVIAEWEKPYGMTDGTKFIDRLRRMANEKGKI